jgi:hypothetical protein
MKQKPIVLFVAIFGAVGLLFAVIGFTFIYNNYIFVSTASNTKGTVVSIERHTGSKGSVSYYPVIKFYPDNGDEVIFTSEIGSNPAPYKINQTVDVKYEPSNPSNAKVDSFTELWVLPGIFSTIGTIFFIIAIATALGQVNANKQKEWLLKNGYPIDTKFVNTFYGNFKVNGQSSIKIKSQWLNPKDNLLYEFNSEDIWFDPTEFIKDNSIKVYIDKDNPKKYYMDISFLPQKA